MISLFPLGRNPVAAWLTLAMKMIVERQNLELVRETVPPQETSQ